MPGHKNEPLWVRAKAAVSKARKKPEAAFTDLDWGLVQKIYQSMGGT